jgi:hypothetical protein
MLGLTRSLGCASLAPFGPNLVDGLAAGSLVIDGPAEPDPSMLEGGSRSAALQTTPHGVPLHTTPSCPPARSMKEPLDV